MPSLRATFAFLLRNNPRLLFCYQSFSHYLLWCKLGSTGCISSLSYKYASGMNTRNQIHLCPYFLLWWLSSPVEHSQRSLYQSLFLWGWDQSHRQMCKTCNLLHPTSHTPIFNDNRAAVDWPYSFSTNGIWHLNIRENAVREAQSHNEVAITHISGTCNPSDNFTKEFKSECISKFQNSKVQTCACSRSHTALHFVLLVLS